MDFTFVPYLIPYLLLFLFWMLSIHRQILFWLYLWQLKEYHLGRFLDHFSTAKGKSLFFNPLFAAKILLLSGAVGFYFWFAKSHSLPIGSPVLFPAWILFVRIEFWFLASVLLLFFLEAGRAALGIVKMALKRPVVTKKSLLLLAACHILFFGAAIVIFSMFLAESAMLEFVFASFLLLFLDVLSPLFIGAIVMALQPLTILEKSKILKKAAAIIVGRRDLVVIGVTGSYGKSAVKELLARILSQKSKVFKTPANQNTEIGVAQAIIDGLKPEHKFFVCEIGAVHKGRIKQVAGIVKPKIGIITGINQQHMGIFGSQQNIIDGKFELLEVLPPDGTAILNWASPFVAENFEKQKNKIKARNYIFAGKDIEAGEIKTTVDRLLLTINHRDEKILLNTNARGVFMVEPILLAAAGAMAAGMSLTEIAAILNKTDFTPFNIKTGKNAFGMNILNSTYSSNPDGVAAHLDYLKLWPSKKAIIMPCLIELGKSSKDVHFRIGQKIAQVCEFAVITTKDRFQEIQKGAISAGMESENIIFSEKPAIIDNLIKNRFSAGDAILLEGRISKAIIDLLK
jgi:UDP-N-acetylmuramoyl-tripeptide--D-alanyl-D-alanine ligase